MSTYPTPAPGPTAGPSFDTSSLPGFDLNAFLAAANAGPTGGYGSNVPGQDVVTAGVIPLPGVPDQPGQHSPVGVPYGYAYQPQATPGGATRYNAHGDPYYVPNQPGAPVPPRYFDGDELIPAMQGWGPDKIAQYQSQMAKAGLLSGYHKGVWDHDSQKAFYAVLGYANQNGLTYDQALARFTTESARAALGGGGGGGPTRAPLSVRLTNPDDLKAVASTVAVSVLGRDLTAAEKDKFVASFHSAESSAQHQAYNAAYNGGTAVDAPNPQVAAEKQTRAAHPTEAGGHDVANAFDTFAKIIGAQL